MNSGSATKHFFRYLKFIPEEAQTGWDEIEVYSVFENKNGFCEVVEEGQESFWSVYLHQLNGGVKCIADLPTKYDAIKLANLLELLTATRVR